MSKELTNLNFEESLNSNKVVVVDFWAPWCGPCKVLSPIIDELADQYKDTVEIGKVNVEFEDELAQRYSIKSVPTIIIFKDGEVVEKLTGPQSKSSLEDIVNGFI